MADAVPTAGSTVSYTQPQYYSDTGASVAGGVQDMLGTNGYLNSVMGNWYDQSPGQGPLGQVAQYNPAQQQTFMNPYTQDAAQETMRLSNQNLTENVLPQVNSTFTGAGQFGSSRNADFNNRAIRDNQTSLNGALSTMFMKANDTANTQYKDWTQQGINAGQQDFTNWMQKANFPVSALGTMGQVTGNIRPSSPSSVSTEQADIPALQKLAMALTAANTGATDGTLQSILSMLGIGGSTGATV
jgi:hypothetical protein